MKRERHLALFLSCFVLLLALSGCSAPSKPEPASAPSQAATAAQTSADETESAAKKELNFPTKSINIIVPVDAGGGSDTMARAISAVAEKYFGQPVVVVNRGGAGGTVGTTEFMSYPPDGYNLLLAHAAIFTTQPKIQDVAYTPDDFAGVIGLNNQPIVMVVKADSPFKSFEDVVSCGHQVKLAANSVGSIFHIAAMDLMKQAGVDGLHIPFNGGNPGLMALLGGDVEVGFFHPEEVFSQAESGDVRILGTMTAERLEAFPDAPTFKELGYDMEYGVWKALLAPAGTDPEIIGYLNAAFTELFEDPDFRTYVENTSINMEPLSGAEVDAKIRAEVDSYADVIKDLNLQN